MLGEAHLMKGHSDRGQVGCSGCEVDREGAGEGGRYNGKRVWPFGLEVFYIFLLLDRVER